jgi:hypothetical protein
MRATRITAMIPMKVHDWKNSIPAFLSDDKEEENRPKYAWRLSETAERRGSSSPRRRMFYPLARRNARV